MRAHISVRGARQVFVPLHHRNMAWHARFNALATVIAHNRRFNLLVEDRRWIMWIVRKRNRPMRCWSTPNLPMTRRLTSALTKERKSAVKGKRVSISGDLGGRGVIKKTKNK